VLKDAAVAAVVVAMVVLTFLAAVFVFGGLRTSGSHIDWNAVAALATLGSVVATVGALGLLRFTAAQLQLATVQLRTQTDQLAVESRQQRIALQPYLRVDVGFEEESGREAGFRPRTSKYVFSAAEFRLLDQADDMSGAAPGSVSEPSFGFCVWATNLQQTSIAVAYNIEVDLVVGWRRADGVEEALPVQVQFAYLEPGQTTAVRIARVAQVIDWFVAAVEDVRYQDVFGTETLVERHGAQHMLYNREGVTNDRSAVIRPAEER
jgi:hypothetical protein